MASLVELLSGECHRVTGRVSSGLILSLQGQNLLYIQSFDDSKRQHLSQCLEKEKWNEPCSGKISSILARLQDLPALAEAFNAPTKNGFESGSNTSNNNNKDKDVTQGTIQVTFDKIQA